MACSSGKRRNGRALYIAAIAEVSNSNLGRYPYHYHCIFHKSARAPRLPSKMCPLTRSQGLAASCARSFSNPAGKFQSVEQADRWRQVAGRQRFLAAGTDGLPWLFVSERGQPLTRQSVNYLARRACRAQLRPTAVASLVQLLPLPTSATMCATFRERATSRASVPRRETPPRKRRIEPVHEARGQSAHGTPKWNSPNPRRKARLAPHRRCPHSRQLAPNAGPQAGKFRLHLQPDWPGLPGGG